MDKKVIENLLGNVPQGKIGVIGDFCTDVYWDIRPEKGEISLETGLTTIPVTSARYSPGGAGNIVANLRGLLVEKIPCAGALGCDPFGVWMRNELIGRTPEYAGTLLAVSRRDYHTPVYCKPLLKSVEQSRIDLGNTPLAAAETGMMLDELEKLLPQLKVLIVNGQLACGIHHGTEFRERFAAVIKKFVPQIKFVFDGRDYLDAYPGVTLKINAPAASGLAFGKAGYPPEESGKVILERTGDELVITDGENGCYVFEKSGTTFIPAIRYDGPVDTVGAGDSFTAGFAYGLAAGASMVDSAAFGTCCSAVTIRKLNQTGAPSPEEIRQILP